MAATAPDDVSADALLLSRAVGRPVRVQLTREQEHAWEPKGTAQLMERQGRADGRWQCSGLRFRHAPIHPTPRRPRRCCSPGRSRRSRLFRDGDRTAIPALRFDNMRVVVHDMPPIVRASWLRGVSALPNTFAHESYIDELATEAGVDPIEISPALPQGTRARSIWSRRSPSVPTGRRVRSGRNRQPKTISCAGAALPTRSMSIASFRATARRGRPGSRMSRSTRQPVMSA